MSSEIINLIDYAKHIENPIAFTGFILIIVFLLYQRFFGSEYARRKDYYESIERTLKAKTEECERLQQRVLEQAREIEELRDMHFSN